MEINFKDFKDEVFKRLYNKLENRLDEVRIEFAKSIFEEPIENEVKED